MSRMRRFIVTETITLTRVHTVAAVSADDAIDVVLYARGDRGKGRMSIAAGQVLRSQRTHSKAMWSAIELEPEVEHVVGVDQGRAEPASEAGG